MTEAARQTDVPRQPGPGAGHPHQLLRELLHTEADLVALVALDGRLLAVSPTVATVLGITPSTEQGTLCQQVHPADRGTLRLLGERLANDGHLRITIRMHRADDAPVWLDVAASVLRDEDDEPVGYVSARDVTDDILAMHHLAVSEQQWRVAFEHSPIGGALLDEHSSVLLSNLAMTEMLGYRSEELCRLSLRELMVAADWAAEEQRWAELVAGRLRGYAAESRLVTNDGRVIWCHLTAAGVSNPEDDAADGVDRVMVQLQDITERREAELQLANRALHDGLTGLPNRFMTRQWLSSALDEHGSQAVGILYCDIDRFKVVNDSLGHAAGDELLATVAARVRAAVREEDLVGRVGGDEFVVVCEGVTGTNDLLGVAAQMMSALDEPVQVAGYAHTVTISVGAAVGRNPESADAALMRADMALLRAKRMGRARVELFDPAVDRTATAQDLALEDQLRQSVPQDQLRRFYQPIVRLTDRMIEGFECLVRWQHPEQGLLSPDQFLELAESSGVIRPIGWWVLATACQEISALEEVSMTRPWLSVNASPSQLGRARVVPLVTEALNAGGLRPERLHLEITETALMHASQTLIAELRQLSDMGVRIVLDDFGTGYSSLSLLRDLPVDMVKIDRSFVRPLTTDRSALAIVRAILSMCRDLGLPTVAEGVENEQQVALLTELGCSHAQGFLFGRPRPLEDRPQTPANRLQTLENRPPETETP